MKLQLRSIKGSKGYVPKTEGVKNCFYWNFKKIIFKLSLE
tara:strand:- start:343 stop:462 length:120 start_codon:yes stop_codon:yes gene_type:complete